MTSGADVFVAAFESLTPGKQRAVFAVTTAEITASEPEAAAAATDAADLSDDED